jgi:hypothetical protein
VVGTGTHCEVADISAKSDILQNDLASNLGESSNSTKAAHVEDTPAQPVAESSVSRDSDNQDGLSGASQLVATGVSLSPSSSTRGNHSPAYDSERDVITLSSDEEGDSKERVYFELSKTRRSSRPCCIKPDLPPHLLVGVGLLLDSVAQMRDQERGLGAGPVTISQYLLHRWCNLEKVLDHFNFYLQRDNKDGEVPNLLRHFEESF